MIKFKKTLSLVLVFALLASVCTNGSMPVFAVGSEPILTAVPADVTPTEESLGTQVAYIANDTVTVYEYYENGALGMVCTGALGEQIELTKKFTYTVDGVDTVIYHFADSDFDGALGEADDANYQFILASDVTFTAPELTPDPEPTETVIPDSATGVSVAGDLPDDVTLTVTEKTLAESGIDTTTYPISGASLFYDVTLLKESTEYQPENGITVTFPEAAITNSGLAVGDYYKVYHIHDGVTDVTGPFEYTGGAIDATFYSLSVVGLAESETGIKVTDVYGDFVSEESYTGYAVINSDTIRVYGAADTGTTDYHELTGVKGIALELISPKATYANGVLYHFVYNGTDEMIKTVNYYFIPEEFITITCCGNCTGEAGCTCVCENCTCGDATTERTLTDEDYPGVSVRGELPSNVTLSVSESLSSNIDPHKESMFLFNDNHIALDIKLLQNGAEYQPEKPVTVTMEASALSLQNGHHFTVYHIHNGVLELLGIYTVADNIISFEVTSFSDFVINNSTATNSNVHSYYEAIGSSGNGNFNIVGVYYEDDGNGNPGKAHIIIKNMTNMNVGNADKIDDVFVNGELGANIYHTQNATSENAFGAVEALKVNLLILEDKNGNELGRIGETSGKSGGYVDIMVEGVEITDTFDLTVKSTTGTVENAFNIGGAEVEVILNYGVTKNVYSVNGDTTRSTSIDADGKKTAVSVSTGETVVYKIVAYNDTGSTIEISEANITDFLPNGVFDESTIYVSNSLDGEWTSVTIATNETGNKVCTLNSNLTLAAGGSTTLYLKATVLSTLKVSEETTYTNEAQLGGGNTTVIANDKADIIVSPPVVGNLTITKKVDQEYPGDTPEIPADGFEFTVVFGDGTDTTTSYPYTIGGTTGTITSGGTIKLGDGQTAVFSDIPVGTSYTVTENLGDLSDDYTTTVNGATGVTASGTMGLGVNQVTFVNTYTQHFTDLTITKTGAQMNLDENQSFIFDVVGPDGFKITVTINGNGSVTIKNVPFGTYTVTEQTEWSWRYNPKEESIAKELNSDPTLNYFNFSNNRTMIYWLSGDSYCKNWWGNNGNVISNDDEE